MADPALLVDRLCVGYGAAPPIVRDLSITLGSGTLGSGEIVVLLGTNGAGKSTALKAIAGVVPPRSGRVTCFGTELAGQPPWLVAQAGLGYVPQRGNVFGGLTVRENLAVGTRARAGRTGPGLAWVMDLFPELAAHVGRQAGLLSGGQRQMVAIGRALLGAPSVLLLDEPAAGLAGIAAARLFAALTTMKAIVPILLVEQDVRGALAIADRACVMAGGTIRLATRPGDPAIHTLLTDAVAGAGAG